MHHIVHSPSSRPVEKLWLLFDYLLLSYTIWIAYRTTTILVITIVVSLHTINSWFALMNRLVSRMIAHHRAHPYVYTILPCRTLRAVNAYLVHYSSMINFVLRNQRIWSPIFFVFVLTNLPVNMTFLVVWMRIRSLNTDNQVLLVLMLFMQCLSTACAMMSVSNVSASLHSASRHTTPLQLIIRNKTSLKYKLLKHYELVHSNRLIGYTPGPLNVLSHQELGRVSWL